MGAFTTFTSKEVADILQVSPRTVERLVAQGTLQAVRVGRRLRITQHQLQAYLHQESTSPSDTK
jgi:excisionase family DNA binding protein